MSVHEKKAAIRTGIAGIVIVGLFLLGIGLVALSDYLFPLPKAPVVRDGMLVITQAVHIEHDVDGLCCYAVGQDDGGDEFDVKFYYVAPCDRHHVWDRLALVGSKK